MRVQNDGYNNLDQEINMFSTHCNIDKADRINRSVIGAMLLIAALIGMSKVFYMVVGLILIIEGLVGWCSIPYLVSKLRRK